MNSNRSVLGQRALWWIIVLSVLSCTRSHSDDQSVAAKPAPAPPRSLSLPGLWELTYVDDTLFEIERVLGFPDVTPTLLIETGKIGGYSGCNGFGARARFTDSTIVITEPVVATERGCGDSGWEATYFHRLQHTTSYRLDSQYLTLSSEGGHTLRFTPKRVHPLAANRWELTHVNDTLFDIKQVYWEKERQPMLVFDLDRNQVGGFSGCNSFGMEVVMHDAHFEATGNIHSDARGCYPGWSEKFFGILADNERFEIDGDLLLLTNSKGRTMTFKKID